MTNKKLENINGNLRDAYRHSVPGTILCVDELMNERRTNPEIGLISYFTADGFVYSVDNGVPTLRITREATNPVLKNLEGIFEQPTTRDYYKLTPSESKIIRKAQDIVTIDLTKLNLKGGHSGNRLYLPVNEKAIIDYNPEEKKLVQRIFGPTMEDCNANLEMIEKSNPYPLCLGMGTGIIIPNPDYVRTKAEKGAIGLSSLLKSYDQLSFFHADFPLSPWLANLRAERRSKKRII